MGKLWSKEEIAYLRKRYPTMDASKIAERLGRSIDSVILKAGKCGFKSNKFRRWEEWENRYLRRHYNEKVVSSIARTLRRTVPSVYVHAKMLRLTSPPSARWTPEERKYMEAAYPNISIPIKEICEHLKRPKIVIYSYAQAKGLYRGSIYKTWTDEELKYIRKNYRRKSFKDIAKDIGLPCSAIKYRANKYGLYRKPRCRLWTEQENEYVRNYYSVDTIEEIAKHLSRTRGAILGRADRLGLRGKHNWYKPANIETRVRKFKVWNENQKLKYGSNFNSRFMKKFKRNKIKTIKQL